MCLVKDRDFHTLPKLCLLYVDEGFDDFDIWNIGGLWVMLEFKTKEVCKSFMSTDPIDHWIMEKRVWNRNVVLMDQIV